MTPILATKLYIPPPPPHIVSRPQLTERLGEGLYRKLTLLSAPAGFGKTTLVSAWLSRGARPAAWLSLEEAENDPLRFLRYLVAAVQTLAPTFGAGLLNVLQAPQPPPTEALLTVLLNDLTTLSDPFILVLDDYHVLDTKVIDEMLTFLVEHLPPQMHLVIITREDPHLPLARLRARGQLSELRVNDLRFTHAECAAFLNQIMGLKLSADDIVALERRTEGWIAGLQLAAISMQVYEDAASFIRSFTGSHHFVMDYLVEEVLQQQSAHVQRFLLHTSILDRFCSSLCDAVLPDASLSGRATLEYLERANLFIIPLDNERSWYRYHHLFADLLRQRLHHSATSAPEDGVAKDQVNILHIRASQWYEDHDLELEAFQHAIAGNDIDRATRLVEGQGVPLHFRGALTPVLHWLESLPETVLNARPVLWVMYASALSMGNHLTGVEARLQAAETALQGAELDEGTRNLIGHIAAIRALLAATQYQVETVIAQSQRALEYLRPDNLAVRTATTWKLGLAYQFLGDRVKARLAYTEAVAISEASGNLIINTSAAVGLGNIQEADNQLSLATETYLHVLQLAGVSPQPIACEAHLGLARIYYEWNDLEAANRHAQQSLNLAQQIENTDRFIASNVMLARLKLAEGDTAGAAALLAEARQSILQHKFMLRMPEVADAQVLLWLRQGRLAEAAQLVQEYNLPISQARTHLAQGDASAALAVLSSTRESVEAKGWQDEQLKVMVLQAVVLAAHGNEEQAQQVLHDVLVLAEPASFIRLFVDEGTPMLRLLSAVQPSGAMPDYTGKLLAALHAEGYRLEDAVKQPPALFPAPPPAQPLIEPLSHRELEVLHLMAQGLSNQEICARLFLALDTVKGHNRRIFGKLQAQRRTEAVARARELGLL